MYPSLAAPLVRWDPFHVVLSLGLVEQKLRNLLVGVEQVQELRLEGTVDGVRVLATLAWKGRHARVATELTEIRLRHRRLGFRVRRTRLMGGVRLPRVVIETLLRSLRCQLVTVLGGRGVVVVDLTGWLPPELTASVLTVQCSERYLHVWFGPGELRDVPADHPKALVGRDSSTLPPALP